MTAERADAPFLHGRIWEEHLRPLAADLLPRAGTIAQELTDRIHRLVPEIAEDPELAEETLASAEANLAMLLSMLRDGIEPGELDPPPAALIQARQYARRGGDLTALLRTYRIGHAHFWALWLPELHRQVDDPALLMQAVEQSSGFFFAYIDAISSRLVKVFSAERERWVRSAAALRGDTVRAILGGEFTDAVTAGRRLRYELDRSHLAFVVWSDPTEHDMLGVLEEYGARVAAALGSRTSLLVPLGRLLMAGWVGGTPALSETDLRSLSVEAPAKVPVRVAVGLSGHGLEGFRRSHLQALHARRVAELVGQPAGAVTRFRDVALMALATADLQLARWFMDDELGKLAGRGDAVMRVAETLQVYLEEASSPARTARRLGIHQNTVFYRLRQAEEMIGHSVEERRLELGMALALARRLGTGDGASATLRQRAT